MTFMLGDQCPASAWAGGVGALRPGLSLCKREGLRVSVPVPLALMEERGSDVAAILGHCSEGRMPSKLAGPGGLQGQVDDNAASVPPGLMPASRLEGFSLQPLKLESHSRKGRHRG